MNNEIEKSSFATMDIDDIMEDLKEYIEVWGLATRTARREKRLNSSLDELDRFYTSMAPRMESVIEQLNQFPVNNIPAKYRPLALTVFAMCEIDAPVTKWRRVMLDNMSNPRHGVGKRSFYQRKMPADTGEVWSELSNYQDEGKGPLVLF